MRQRRQRQRSGAGLPIVHSDGKRSSLQRSTKQRRWRRCKRILTIVAVGFVVLVVCVVDFWAIVEWSDAIEETQPTGLKNTTLILMIDTRQPPADTACINRAYAKQNGYDFELVTYHPCFDNPVFAAGVAHLWCRPLIFRDALSRYESILYLDADAWFTRPSRSIEEFFQYARDNHYYLTPMQGNTTFVGAEDCAPYWTNGGVQFWRRTRYTNHMLTMWYLMYRRQFIFHWLYISWLPTYEIHYFANREQGSWKVAVEENPWMMDETSVIKFGPETWLFPYHSSPSRECQWGVPVSDTYFLNHIVGAFGPSKRDQYVKNYIREQGIECETVPR